MRKHSTTHSGIFTTRAIIACALFSAAILLGTFSFVSFAATSPASGTLKSTNIGSSNAINYTDSVGSAVPNLTFFAGNGTCAAPMSCSTFTLTIDPSVGTPSSGYDPTQYQIFIQVSWATATEDYDTWMCSGSGNCT